MSTVSFVPTMRGARTLRGLSVPSALVALLLAASVARLGIDPRPAEAQSEDKIQVAGTALGPGDSTKARRLLQADLSPKSSHWTQLHDSEGQGQAVKTFHQAARLAYPAGVRADSMIVFSRSVGTGHPDPAVRAEFLFGGLQVAASAGRDEAREQLYRRLTSEHETSEYAEQARRLFAPDSPIEAGRPLPELTLPKLSDPTATFSEDDFEGKTVLIDFWGTWCPPCVRAMPHLHEAYRQHGGKDFTILSVALRDSPEAVEEFRANKWAMPWNHALVPKESDLQKKLQGRFDIRGLPLAILVGPDGQIRHVSRGVGSGEETAQAVREAVGGKGSPGNTAPGGATSEATGGEDSPQ